MFKFRLSIALALVSLSLLSQDIKFKSGPMLGYAEMREALVWLQLDSVHQVYALYREVDKEDSPVYRTASVETRREAAFSAKLYFDEIEPGRCYRYRIFADEQELTRPYPLEFCSAPLWEYRSDPPAFSMAMGSCAYINEEAYDRPGRPYGGQYAIFESISAMQPDAMLWLGDNAYLRPADWWSRTGYLKRYSHSRAVPEMQPLLAQANNFAIWDDHDFGPNDASGSWVLRETALEVFKLFWANPSYGYADLPGTMGAFRYRDCDFVLMDNRYHRTETSAHHPEQIFGREQIDRAIDLLKQSRAPFKFVVTGGQFLNSAKVYENHSNYPEEREYFLQRIAEENIQNLIFISGDRHHSEVMRYALPNGQFLHEFTVSPLTSGANKNVNEDNAYRVEGSLIQVRNYAIMKLSGKRKARQLDFHYYDSAGKELYHYQLKE